MKTKFLILNLCWLVVLLTGSINSWSQPKKNLDSKKPLVVFVTGDHEYSGEFTMPPIAAEPRRPNNRRSGPIGDIVVPHWITW